MTHRVVSLIASATEIVAALGCEGTLVGRSHECDYPPGIQRLPACSEPRFDIHGDSREIDQRVKQALSEALSVYRVDADTLERLQPTVIITQTQCEVCAVSLKDVQDALCRTVSSQPVVVALEPNSLADLWRDIERVAAALDVPESGRQLVQKCQERLAGLSELARGWRGSSGPPRVACIEWQEPLMAAGNWVPELVDLVGGENLFGVAGKHSPWMTWGELVAADPDVLAIMPCGFDIARTRSEMHWLTSRPEWSGLRAVRNGAVFLTDGNQYFNRPGPRVVESAEILCELLYPGVAALGHHGTGWIPWESLEKAER